MLKGRILKLAAAAAMIASAPGITILAATGATASAAHVAASTATSVVSRSTVTTMPKVSAAPSTCPAGALCGYTGANYTGREGELFGDNPDLNVPGDVWNNVASIYNNGQHDNVVVYRGENYSSDGGHQACLYRQTGFPNMGSQLPGLYHHIWSNFWITQPCT
jgi:hypothetical protein